jgi:hypothetical protein
MVSHSEEGVSKPTCFPQMKGTLVRSWRELGRKKLFQNAFVCDVFNEPVDLDQDEPRHRDSLWGRLSVVRLPAICVI